MDAKDDAITPEAFAVLVAQAGLRLTPRQAEELRSLWPHIAQVKRRIRAPRDYASEPAHVFRPVEG